MKKILKSALLFLMISPAFSFKATEASWNEKKVIQLEKKYHLKRISGAVPANAKHFATLEEFEAFLKSRSKKFTATAKASATKNFRRVGGSATASVYDDGLGGYFASLNFGTYLSDYGYPESLDISWQDNNLPVSSQLRTNSFIWYPFVQNWSYSQESGTKDYNTMSIIGEYEETYSNGSITWTSTYDVEIGTTFNASSISATIYIEDRGW